MKWVRKWRVTDCYFELWYYSETYNIMDTFLILDADNNMFSQAVLERLNNQVLQMPAPAEFEQLVQPGDDAPSNGLTNGSAETDHYEDAD